MAGHRVDSWLGYPLGMWAPVSNPSVSFVAFVLSLKYPLLLNTNSATRETIKNCNRLNPRSVKKRNVQTCKNFWVYLSQTDDNCWEAKSLWTEKMLQRMAVLHLLCNRGGGRHEKAKWGNLWDWVKIKRIDTYFFPISGCRIVNN